MNCNTVYCKCILLCPRVVKYYIVVIRSTTIPVSWNIASFSAWPRWWTACTVCGKWMADRPTFCWARLYVLWICQRLWTALMWKMTPALRPKSITRVSRSFSVKC